MFSPTPSAGAARWSIVRVRAGSQTEVIVVGSKLLPLSTHWIAAGRGRSVLCPVDDCPLCVWLPVRGFFYLPVIWDARQCILELSSLAASHFEQHCKLLHGGIRPGLVVALSRKSAKQPIRSEVVEEREGVAAVDFLTFCSRVMAVYNYPPANPVALGSCPMQALEMYERRLMVAARVRAQLVVDELQAASAKGC